MQNKKKHKKRNSNSAKDNYLPLLVAKELKDKASYLNLLFGNKIADNIEYLLSATCTDNYRKTFIEKNINRQAMQDFLNSNYGQRFTESSITMEYFRTNKMYLTIKRWEQNKQVFQFDKTFVSELLETENIEFVKNSWDYLLFNDFYIDLLICKNLDIFSDNPQGIFLSVRKMDISNLVPDEKETLMYSARQSGANDVKEDTKEIYIIDMTFAFEDVTTAGWNILFENENKAYGKDGLSFVTEVMSSDGIAENVRRTQKFVLQILNYLSSEKPEITESEETQHTYRKRSSGANPKLKFSEIQKWNVGYRYGAAFRKWKNEVSENDESHTSFEENHTGKPVKPHYRRAHWHYYWYGKKGSSERIKRPVWISTVAVNMDKIKESEMPAVIHKVEVKERSEK